MEIIKTKTDEGEWGIIDGAIRYETANGRYFFTRENIPGLRESLKTGIVPKEQFEEFMKKAKTPMSYA